MPGEHAVQYDPSLFDAAVAADSRDDALERAQDAAGRDWNALADAAIRRCAENNPTFIVDAVWRYGLPERSENRALGARMLAAVRAGVIEATSDYRPSARATSHKVPRRVWRSLIYGRG
jgi:hypothetical protein